MSRTYVLKQQQVVPRPLDEVFAFFANPANLQTLTPESLHFQITTPQPIEMRAGTIIDYRLRLFGIPFSWRTLIESFEPMRRFVDVQAKGPYRSWRHTHEFAAVPDGTHVRDTVNYELPLGPLGGLAHGLFVRRSLTKIFDYRQGRMTQLFPPEQAATSL